MVNCFCYATLKKTFVVCSICTMITLCTFLRPSGLGSQSCLLAIWFRIAVEQLVLQTFWIHTLQATEPPGLKDDIDPVLLPLPLRWCCFLPYGRVLSDVPCSEKEDTWWWYCNTASRTPHLPSGRSRWWRENCAIRSLPFSKLLGPHWSQIQ